MQLTTQLTSLPREARDTLFLLGVIALIVLPQIGNLPFWCTSLVAVVLLWRGTLAVQARPLPNRWWRGALLLVALVGTYVTHRTLLGRDAGVTLVVVLLALKTLELRARRDAFVIFFLGFFAMLTNFFYSQSLPTAFAMLLALLGLLTALVNAHMPVGRPPLVQAARTAGGMALLGAPIMVLLFVLFPRMAPLWGTPNDAMTGRSGLSATMRVGAIAQLALDDGIAARVKFDDDVVPDRQVLYFRGPVLSQFDGREWTAPPPFSRASAFTPANLRVSGTPVRYAVTLEPSNRPWLLTLDAAPVKPDLPGYELFGTPELQWLASRPIGDLVRYRAESYTQYQSGPLRRTGAVQLNLDLPRGSNPRTVALAAQLRSDPANATTPALVQAVLQRLRTGGYTYTLDPGVYGDDTADVFWFERKEGFCEHIASAFVVLMRAAGVPARIVTGYQGGERNDVDGYWTLRNSDAHAWAEVWQEGVGWVRVDPTGSVAPGRVGTFNRLAPTPGVFAGAFGAMSPTLVQNMRAAWEALNNGWNQWVLNYTQSKQLDLLKNLGFDSPSLADLGLVLLWLLVATSLAGAAWTLWERSRTDPWLRLLAQARKRLQKAGIALPPTAPPRQMAEQVRARFGDAGKPLQDWLLQLEAQRYARESAASAKGLASLRSAMRRIPWPQG